MSADRYTPTASETKYASLRATLPAEVLPVKKVAIREHSPEVLNDLICRGGRIVWPQRAAEELEGRLRHL
jgi:hypothetical protein